MAANGVVVSVLPRVVWIFLVVLLRRQTVCSAKCTIDVSTDLNASSPLFLDPLNHEIVYPSRLNPRTLRLSAGDKLLLQCSNGKLVPSPNSASDLTHCVAGKTFSNNKNKAYSIDAVHCSNSLEPTMRQDPTRRCGDRGVVVNVGYELNSSMFLTTLDACYVDNLATTAWAHSKIPAAVAGFRSKEPQTAAFSKGNYFKSVSMSRVYPRKNQVQTFLDIFDGNEKLVDEYLPSTGDKKNYFVKGHLVARADKYYHAEQQSTYFYVNALPMWQSINNGNWRSVETTVRRYAGSVDGAIDVWTGGIDVLRLSGKEIYLAKSKRNARKRLVPAPKLLFKLVYNSRDNQALVFLTVNNPYVAGLTDEYRVCDEYRQCAEKFKQFRKTYEGYTYCCTYGDFVEGTGIDLPVVIRNPKPLTLY